MVVPIGFPDSGVNAKTPTAPPLSPQNVPSRRDQDEGVHFIVGPEKFPFIIRGVLLSYGCLAIMIRRKNRLNPGCTDNKLILDRVPKEGFEMLVKYLEGEKIKITSMSQALLALKTSVYCECPSLCKLAINYCDLNLSQDTVLDVMETVVPLDMELTLFEDNWSYTYHEDPSTDFIIEIKSLITALKKNCEIIFSNNADTLLLSPDFFSLAVCIAKEIILACPKLFISNELILWNVIVKWCDKFLADMSSEEQREEVREVLRSIRYGLMTEDDFMNGPGKSKLLTQSEIGKIRAYIRREISTFEFDDPKMNVDLGSMRKMRVPNNDKPFDLSIRTQGESLPLCNYKENFTKLKTQKKEKKPPKVLLGLLRCWQIVFD